MDVPKVNIQIHTLVHQHALPADIFNLWQGLTGELQEKVLCLAVYYKHKTFVQEMFHYINPYTEYSPLVLAIDQDYRELVKLLAENTVVYPDVKYLGILIVNEGEWSSSQKSAFDVILKKDNSEALEILLPSYRGLLQQVSLRACPIGSPQCRKLLDKWMADSGNEFQGHLPPKHPAYPSLEKALRTLIEFTCYSHGKTTAMQYESAVVLFKFLLKQVANNEDVTRIKGKEYQTRFLTSDNVKNLELVLEYNATEDNRHLIHAAMKAGHVKKRKKGSPYFEKRSHALNPFSCVILESCNILLSQMARSTLSASPVTQETFSKISQKLLEIFKKRWLMKKEDVEDCAQSMILLNLMSELFLQAGIDHHTMGPESFRKENIINTFLESFKHVQTENLHNSQHAESEITKHVDEHLRILLAYGYAEVSTQNWNFYEIKSPQLIKTAHMCMSVMSHDAFEQYRCFILSKKNKHMNQVNPEEEVDNGDEIALEAPRSLKTISRLKIHNSVAKGRMPHFVQTCEKLNNEAARKDEDAQAAKEYLLLGVTPL